VRVAASFAAMDVYPNTADARAYEPVVTVHDFWLLALRLVSAFCLIYFQAWDQIKMAWAFVWEKVPWELVDQLTAASFPAPTILAPLLIFLLLVVAVALGFGFLSRIVSLMGVLICGLVLTTKLELSSTLTSQTLVLYCSVLLVLVFAGGGRISLDTLLTRRKTPA